jgi:hypothetical protein
MALLNVAGLNLHRVLSAYKCQTQLAEVLCFFTKPIFIQEGGHTLQSVVVWKPALQTELHHRGKDATIGQEGGQEPQTCAGDPCLPGRNRASHRQ